MRAFLRTFDILNNVVKDKPLEKCIGSNDKDGNWKWYSTQELYDLVNKTSIGLLSLGLSSGDKVAIAAYRNRVEWTVVDLACAQLGVISVPVYPTISSSDYHYIFEQAEVKYAFVGGGDLAEKCNKAGNQLASFIKTYSFDDINDIPFWGEIHQNLTPSDLDKLKNHSDKVKTEDLCTIIYTSGTTGKPKGVMLSHMNICSAAAAAGSRFPLGFGDPVLSFLPLCHIFERTASLTYLTIGCSIAYTSTDNLGGPDGDIVKFKPHLFTTVPRLLEKIYEKIFAKGNELTGVKKKLFFWALNMTSDYEYQKPLKGFRYKIADKLIFQKWRDALGGEIKCILTGAAPCPKYILRTFSAAGIPILEAYGLTETSPGISISESGPTTSLIGSVGPVLDDVEVKIIDEPGFESGEGEILAHGPNVMMGYYKNPEATSEVFVEIDGKKWFKTGDIGKIVKGPKGGEFLKITDRKKQLLKTSGGKYVAPAPIESIFKKSALIEHAIVIGDQRKFVSALFVPSLENSPKWCADNGIEFTNLEALVKNPKFISAIQSVVDEVNTKLSKIEKIKKFALLSSQWDIVHEDGTPGELTPTLKTKRKVVLEKYKNKVEEIYNV